MEKRTGWEESDRRRREEKWQIYGVAETSKERAELRTLQRRNLNILGLPKRKEWSQCHRESSWQECRSRPCHKEQSRLSRVSDHEGRESQGGREPHLGEREGDQSESMEWKGWTPP